MAESLLLDDLELLGGTPAGPFTLIEMEDALGAAVPDQATVASVLLDGDRVSGDRYGNRTVSMTVRVTGTSRLDMAANVDLLMRRVAQTSFELTWTPDGGLPLVFGCFRGSAVRSRRLVTEQTRATAVAVSFQALPFGASDTAETVTGVAAATVVDPFDTAPTGGTQDTTVKFLGTASAKKTGSITGTATSALFTMSRTVTSVDISAAAAVTVRYRKTAQASLLTRDYLQLTLSSAGGSSSTEVVAASSLSKTTWALIAFDLSTLTVATGTGVDLTAVTGWSIEVAVKRPGKFSTSTTTTYTRNLDDLRAMSLQTQAITSNSGSVVLLPGIIGSARAPISVDVTKPAGVRSLLIHRPPAVQDPDLAILFSLGGTSNETATLPAGNVNFDGTYSVVAALSATAGAVSRTFTCTVTKTGTGRTSTTTRTVTVSADPEGNLLSFGEVELPLLKTTDENTGASYTIQFQSSNGSDHFSDGALLDTRGPAILASGFTLPDFTHFYVDEPDPAQDSGDVFAAVTDRTDATSALHRCRAFPGGAFTVDPTAAVNKILVLSPAGPPTLTASYYPRWLDERVQ